MLKGCRETVLVSRVEIGSSSGFDLALVVVLGVRSTKGDIRQEDRIRTVDHEEGGVAGSLTFLRAQPPYYSGQFLDPLGAVFFDRVKNSGFEPLEDQAIGPFNLAIAC